MSNVSYRCAPHLSKSQEEIINEIHVRYNINGCKWGPISSPVYRREFYRVNEIKPEVQCEVSGFYFSSKKEFEDALKNNYEKQKIRNAKYKEVAEDNLNLKLCRRCLNAEENKKQTFIL